DPNTVPVSTVLSGRKESSGTNQRAAHSGGKKELSPNTQIDVNRAGADELQKLPGVGPVLARRIIAEREKTPFQSVDELRRVSGIGVKTLEKLRPFVTVGKVVDADAVASQ